MGKQNVLVIASAPLHNGPRMIREIETLKPYYNIFTVGATPPHDPQIPYFPIRQFHDSFFDRLTRKAYNILWGAKRLKPLFYTKKRLHVLIRKIDPDIIIAHDPSHLPYILAYPNRQFKVVYNAHEYHPLEFDEDAKWMGLWGKYYYQLYQEYLPKIEVVINVCDSIAYKCEEEFGVKSIVIPNAAPYYSNLSPVTTKEGGPYRMIHHGISSRTRKIEKMIQVAQKLGSGYHLDLMLVPVDQVYYAELQTLAQEAGNVNLLKPVPYKEIVSFINQYDIGLYNLPPESYNNEVALPNKFFEFIQARLCLVVGPSVEMKKIVENFDLGLVSSDFTTESLYKTIKLLTDKEINRFKENSDKAAYTLSAQNYQKKLVQAFQAL